MTVYALMVGINKYASPKVRNLNGCVQDVNRFEEFLRARVKKEDLAEPMILLDEQATRANIIDRFETHLGQAQNGDTALFYYSGHGSQEQAPAEFWSVEPDKKNETLVCHDSRSGDDLWDLADKELAHLIEEITKNKNIHTVVIIDACHSGSGTRDPGEDGIRMNPADKRGRPIESYLIQAPPAGSQVGDNWYKPPQGNHVLLAACLPEELARERNLGEPRQIQGVFSYYLREALQNSGPDLTYRDLFKHVSAMVRLAVNSQTPQLEIQGENVNQAFLGGNVLQRRKTTYSVAFDGERNQWTIDGGTIHGIGAPIKDGNRVETTRLAVFPKDDTELDLSKALGETNVTQVMATQSEIEPTLQKGEESIPLEKSDTYLAIVIASPLPRLVVQMSGDEGALTAVQSALDTANEGQPSIFVRAAESTADAEAAELTVVALAEAQRYRISRSQDPLALYVDTPYDEPNAAQLVVQRLEHMARWMKVYALYNPDSKIESDDVTLTLTSVDADGQEEDIDFSDVVNLRYKFIDGQWKVPGLRVEINNNDPNQTLYAALVNVAPSYKIWPVAPNNASSTHKLDPGTSVVLAGGKRMTVSIPDNFPKSVVEIQDMFKLIVSTKEFDASILEEKSLPIQIEPLTRGSAEEFKGTNLVDSLTAMLGRIPFRDGGFDDVDTIADWRTINLNVITTRPQSEVDIPKNVTAISLGEGITLSNQSDFTATARLMTDPESGRDVGNLGVPEWLRDAAPAGSEPFALTGTRSVGEPGLSVLDLTEVENHEAVTPDTPLKLTLSIPVPDQDQVLAYGFDGEFYLPVGYISGRTESETEITLEQLPDPEGTKSLTNSIRIYFHKIASQVFDVAFDYPRLAVVTNNSETGEVAYNADTAHIKAAIAGAENIALFVHGIIGETQFMTPCAWTDVDGWQLTDHYDLILAFDYENLDTGILETGVMLRDKLSAVGLGPDHSKQLHIFAHSMGGLVSRGMIEHTDGGKSMVQHLFMLGTPNQGSPLAKVQDWAFTALTLGLNGLTAVTGWPLGVLSGPLGWFENADQMLDEMAPGSTVLTALANAPDPQLPYTLIAGNTGLLAQAQNLDGSGTSRLERLAQRINKYRVMDLAFLKQPNDIAVAVTSAHHISDTRTPKPTKLNTACDHMSYFTIDGGLPTLVAAVREVVE